MASFNIFARRFVPAAFASLAGLMIGLGSAGNLASAAPMAWAAEPFGWRAGLGALAAPDARHRLGLLAFVRDPGPAPAPEPGRAAVRLGDVLRQPVVWVLVPLLTVNYAPVAWLRGLWVGRYHADVFGTGPDGINAAALAMALAMVVGFLA